MTTNLVIADDEYFIRQKIKKLIPFEELDIEFIGECENGSEVIELLSKCRIDIILLDIRMPKLSGIEVAKYVFEHHSDSKIIILSGFNDFEYARTTFRYGVFDYLLKPVEPDALTAALKTCVQKITLEAEQKEQLAKYYHYRKCMKLSDVLRGSLELNSLQHQYPEIRQAEYSLFEGVYTVMECEATAKELAALYQEQGVDCEYFIESEHIFYIQFFLKDDTLEALCRYLCKKFAKDTNTRCYFAFSSMFPIEQKWEPHQKEALFLLGDRYFGSGPDLTKQLTAAQPPQSIPEISDIRHSLLLILNTNDISGFKKYLEHLFHIIGERKSCHYLNLVVAEILLTFSIRYPDSKLTGYRLHDYINAIIAEDYLLEELKNTICSYGLKYMDNAGAIPSDLMLSKKITAYIQEHFTEPDLSVTKLGLIFQLNVSYMGSVFKKTNGQSLLQYITFVRMEASRKLLMSNQYKVGEVAEKVGFTDVFYYSKRFKKMYGYSPKDFISLNNQSL
ncbi:response regulator transcription factor [Anaerocolumna jejuensis]|uniref:response regulator transcription factor n=1 Tax=Anaerocolumna jejuensis TaxID=259063 RepID=UPI003F7B3F8F